MNTLRDLKLAILEAELTAIENQREEIFAEYIKTAIEKALVDEINKLSDEDKVVLLVKLLDKKSADSNCSINDFINDIKNLMKQGVEL